MYGDLWDPDLLVNALAVQENDYAYVNNPEVNPGASACVFSIYLKFFIPENVNDNYDISQVLLSNGDFYDEESLIIGLKKKRDSSYYLFAKIGKQNFYALYDEKAIQKGFWNTICVSSINNKSVESIER